MAFKRLRELLNRIPEDKVPGWKLYVDEKEVQARIVDLVSRFGILRWGFNGAYDQWGFEEPGGGGSVLVPYFKDEAGKLWIGVVEQPRPFQDDNLVLNLPRGFLDPGQNHFEAAQTEALEEIGSGDVTRIFPLEGAPGNPNNTFFITSGIRGDGELMGVRFWGVRFEQNEMQQIGEGYAFNDGVVKPVSGDAEKIMGCKFIPWTEAARLGCMMSNSGVARLVAMESCGRL